jgi:hypothetical protein
MGWKKLQIKLNNLYICNPVFATTLTRGVIGNTSDFGSEESRFEPWRVNIEKKDALSYKEIGRFLYSQDLRTINIAITCTISIYIFRQLKPFK